MTSLSDSALLDPDRLAPALEDPRVADVMRAEVVFCLPSTPIDAVAKLLADNVMQEIVVLLDRRPVGYVTAEDIVERLRAGDIIIAGSDFAVRSPFTPVQVRDIMRTPPLLVDANQRLSEAVAVMAHNRRRLAVVMHEDDTPVGMVTPAEVADFVVSKHVA